MSILLDARSRVMIQGLTGRTGRRLGQRMVAGGTPLVAGVRPGRGGECVAGVRVFDSPYEAVAATRANVSFVAVPPDAARDATLDAIDAGLELIVVYTERVPVHDAVTMTAAARTSDTVLLGPNSAGCVTAGAANVSDLADEVIQPGPVGVVSKSGTLTYEVVDGLGRHGLGVSSVVCLGGDP
ncbi:MAG: succinate--CoA ligase subunit alpha, partial [Egibacteraceae bacterium]